MSGFLNPEASLLPQTRLTKVEPEKTSREEVEGSHRSRLFCPGFLFVRFVFSPMPGAPDRSNWRLAAEPTAGKSTKKGAQATKPPARP